MFIWDKIWEIWNNANNGWKNLLYIVNLPFDYIIGTASEYQCEIWKHFDESRWLFIFGTDWSLMIFEQMMSGIEFLKKKNWVLTYENELKNFLWITKINRILKQLQKEKTTGFEPITIAKPFNAQLINATSINNLSKFTINFF